jgi:hypothetical protein
MEPFVWTPAREEELARLWRDGEDASAIAALWGITRNTVLGKVHRLRKRPGGEERFQRRAGRRIVGPGRLVIKVLASPKPKKRKPRYVPVPKQKPVVTHAAKHKEAKRAKAGQNDFARQKTAKSAGPLTLLDLAPSSCRWILGDVKGPATLFCGRPKDAERGGSYCAEHRDRCVSRPRAA